MALGEYLKARKLNNTKHSEVGGWAFHLRTLVLSPFYEVPVGLPNVLDNEAGIGLGDPAVVTRYSRKVNVAVRTLY